MLYMILTVVESSVKLEITSSMRNQHNFWEKRNTRSIIPILSLAFYAVLNTFKRFYLLKI